MDRFSPKPSRWKRGSDVMYLSQRGPLPQHRGEAPARKQESGTYFWPTCLWTLEKRRIKLDSFSRKTSGKCGTWSSEQVRGPLFGTVVAGDGGWQLLPLERTARVPGRELGMDHNSREEGSDSIPHKQTGQCTPVTHAPVIPWSWEDTCRGWTN